MRKKSKHIVKTIYAGFKENQIQLNSATLTYYTLLTVVPIFALLLIIGEQFQLEKLVQRELLALFKEQPQISTYLIDFAHNALAQTHATAFQIIGVIILAWTAVKLLTYIDISINQLWHAPFVPSFARRNLRFLIMLLVCSTLFFLASSITLFITMAITYLSNKGESFGNMLHSLLLISNLFPSLLTFCLLSFLYYFVPYVKVRPKHALIAGFITAISYQIVQFIYISLQISVASYSALYGTFAAIPLFLIWVHMSWMIFLIGAKLCYSFSHKAQKNL